MKCLNNLIGQGSIFYIIIPVHYVFWLKLNKLNYRSLFLHDWVLVVQQHSSNQACDKCKDGGIYEISKYYNIVNS